MARLLEMGESSKEIKTAQRGESLEASDLKTGAVLHLSPYIIGGAYGLGLNASKQLINDTSTTEIARTKELPLFAGKNVTKIKCSTKRIVV